MLLVFRAVRLHAEVDLRMRRYRGVLRGMEWRSLVILFSLSLIPATSLGQFTNQSAPSGSSGSSGAGSVQAQPAQVNNGTYQGSIVKRAPVPGVLPLSLDEAIRIIKEDPGQAAQIFLKQEPSQTLSLAEVEGQSLSPLEELVSIALELFLA